MSIPRIVNITPDPLSIIKDIESLFGNDSFVRELVSNSIDAVKERLKRDHSFTRDQSEIRVYVRSNEKTATFCIIDNGIGMTYEEAIANLTTLKSTKTQGDDSIGKFGIGFYSFLKVADLVEVSTRSALNNNDGCKMEFNRTELEQGQPSAKVWNALPDKIGTSITLTLNDNYVKDYRNIYQIECILLKYFEFSPYRIFIRDSPKPIVDELPLYLRNDQQNITDEQWRNFLKKFNHGEPIGNFPLTGSTKGVLMIPEKVSVNRAPFGIKLYVHHVFVKDCLVELLPEYFRPFIAGIVDVDSLPLRLDRNGAIKDSDELNSLKRELQETIISTLTYWARDKKEKFKVIMRCHLPHLKQACINNELLFRNLILLPTI